MILTLPELVTPDELALIKQKIATVPFIEGKATAGELLKSVKNNQQIPWNHPVMKEITDLVMRALGRCDAFMSMAYGAHVDAPIMGEPNHVRSDVSFTLFLNEPDTYQGGELAFENGSGETAFKLPARSAICYPTGQLHRVRPVEQGERLAVVGWVQSLVREPAIRELLHDLSEARELLVGQEGTGRAVELLTKSYSNLLRRNAEP